MKILFFNKKTQKICLILLMITACLVLGKLFFAAHFEVFVVGSSSMEPEFPQKSLVIVKKNTLSDLQVGDVVAFKSTALAGQIAMHRITRFTKNGFFVKGDQNKLEDNQEVTKDDYVGKCVFSSHFAGVVVSKIRTPLGFLALVIFPVTTACFLRFLVKKL